MLFILAFRNLSRRPVRSLLTAAGIAIAVAAFIALVGMSRGLENAWIGSLTERGIHIMAVQKGTVEMMTATLNQNLGSQMEKVEHVNAVAGELIDLVALDSQKTVMVRGWPAGTFLWRTLRLDRGHLPAEQESDAIVLGAALAAGLGKAPGDLLKVRDRALRVTGIALPSGSIGNNSIFMLLPAMQKLVEKPGKVTTFNFSIENSQNREALAEVRGKLARAFPDLTFSETSEIADNNDVIKMLRAIAWSTSCIALVMAVVVVFNTLLMAVTERTRELGILSAIGWPSGRILLLVVIEGLLLTLAGSLVGVALGLAGMDWLAALPRLHGFFEPRVDLLLLLEVSISALLLGLLGSLYPAWRAARLNPVDALKYE